MAQVSSTGKASGPATDEQREGYLAQIAYVVAEAGTHDRTAVERRAILRAREERRTRQRQGGAR